jgi:CheY-like chemotaxis protein
MELPSMGKRSILVVDDDDDVRTTLCVILSAEGYAAVGAADGVEALDRMRIDPPALLLVDMMMPRMSGEDLIRAMTQDASLARIPVAIMSGQPFARAAPQGPRVIARLTKPVELDTVLSVVHQFAD